VYAANMICGQGLKASKCNYGLLYMISECTYSDAYKLRPRPD